MSVPIFQGYLCFCPMIHRFITEKIKKALNVFPVVGVIGPRQVGKTTLVRSLEKELQKPTLFLDLERSSDRQKLADHARCFKFLGHQFQDPSQVS